MRGLRLTLLTTAAMLLAAPAFADPPAAGGTTCNGNGSCGSTTTNNTTNAPVANGGHGGTGVGVGIGVGKGGNATAGASASSAASSNQVQVQGQDQDQAVTWINPRNPVSTASAAALATSSEACMGSSSIGGQGVGFGLSFGTTWENEDCKRRKQAGLLFAIGATEAAKEVLCGDPDIRAAYLAGGKPCAADKPALKPAIEPEPPAIEMSPVVPN